MTLARSSLVFVVAAAGCAGIEDPSSDSQAPIVMAADHWDVSPPLRELPIAPGVGIVHPARPLPRASGAPAHDPVVQDHAVAFAPATIANFLGVGTGFPGFTVQYAPPDPVGDVGPNHYVQMVNSSFAVFDKSGTVLYGPTATNTLWAGFGGGCETNNDGDGTVLYDPIADRWLLSQFSVSTTPYLECMAVSQTGDPTGAWNRYSFSFGNTDFPDYPKLGVWPDAYYATFNIFGAVSFTGARACAFDRTAMLAGSPATMQCFNTNSSWGGLLPSDLDGSRLPPSGTPNYVAAFGTNDLGIWKFHVDFANSANSTFTGPTQIAVAAFTDACNDGTCIPQAGTTQQLDSLGDRLMFRLAYRNFGDHEAMVVNHSVTAGSSVGIRWYELRADSNHNVSVFQQGTYAPDSGYRWMGSIAMDHVGDIALGFSLSSSTLHPEIHYTGRLAGDLLGQMTQGEGTIIDGAGSQIGGSTNTPTLSRWGDYSSMTVDPADDCTFYYTQEYIPSNGAFNWATRVGSFKFPGCEAADFSIAASPTSVTVDPGGSGGVTISTTQVGAAGDVALTMSGFPSGTTAGLTPSTVTAGGTAALSIALDAATAPGTYTITVTGTEGTTSHATTFALVVPAPSDFTIAASPTSVTVSQGGSGTSTISTTQVGSAGTVTLGVTGTVPAGLTPSLDATSVAAGGSSTLTVAVDAATAPGTYTLTITGTEGSATHATTVSVTVVAPADFTIAASPASFVVSQAGTARSTIATTQIGSAGTVALAVSGVPAGVTASLSATSVAAGSNATLTLATSTAAPIGTFTITVTGTEGAAVHATNVTLTIKHGRHK